MRWIAAIGATLLLAGCWSHVYPLREQFVAPPGTDMAAARRIELYVDADGSFYPDGWDRSFAPRRDRDPRFSLLEFAGRNRDFRTKLDLERTRQLEAVAAFAKAKKRIFVLIHGFNNTAEEAEAPFDAIEAELDLKPKDGVIRFHWDGLTGSGIGAGRIWFLAVMNSQLAGVRGLRAMLAAIGDKEVYLIGHSRSGSVMLSALGNPVYDRRFFTEALARAARYGIDPARDFVLPKPLPDAPANVHMLVVAPAIGRFDFCDASEQARADPTKCTELRALPRLADFRYTVNGGDPVLDKFVGLSKSLWPTDLGLKPALGEELRRTYPGMTAFAFHDDVCKHAFTMYVHSPAFLSMLADAKILKPGAYIRRLPPDRDTARKRKCSDPDRWLTPAAR